MPDDAAQPRDRGSSCYHCADPHPPLYDEVVEERTGDVVHQVETVVCERHRGGIVTPEQRFVVEELVVGDGGRRAWGLRDMVTQRLVTCGDGETNYWPTPQAAQGARLTYHYLAARAEGTSG